MFIPKDFVPDCDCFAAQICANSGAHAHFGATAYLRDEAIPNNAKSFSTNIGTILNNMLTNFELKRLEPKLDIVEKPENRVHELTDSNGAHMEQFFGEADLAHAARVWSSIHAWCAACTDCDWHDYYMALSLTSD